MPKSLKTNYIFNLLNTISGLLFPLFTFPYASRILLADGIGEVNFFQSIIQYITLLTCLGIPMYAIREISRVRENIVERNKIAIEILTLHAILTVLGYIVVVILAATITKIQVNLSLFFVLSSSIIFTTIGCEWFFQGIEDFKYIAIRGLIIKVISIVLLFLLVKTKEDILWYGACVVFGVLGGNIFNLIRLSKYISFKNLILKDLHPFRHFFPALRIFVLNLIISIYAQLNTIMLGFIDNTTSVGFFTAASKLSHVTLGVVSALGTALLPRLSNLIATGQKEKFNHLSKKAMEFVVSITLPMTVGMILTSPYLIILFCGESYMPAISTLQIISPIILAIGVSNILGIQILYPQGQENKVIYSTVLGAVVNFILNLWLIPKYSQNGASFATVIAELIVTISMMYIGRKYIPICWKNKTYFHYLVGSIFMGTGVYIWNYYSICSSQFINLIFSCCIGVIIYTLYLIYVKDSFYVEMISIIYKRFKSILCKKNTII